MSSTAYHNEALRKARVLERKQDAQTRMKQQYVNQSSLHVQPASTRNISHSQLNGPEMAEYRRLQNSPGVDQKTSVSLGHDRVFEVMHPDDTAAWEVGQYLGPSFDDNEFAIDRHYTHENTGYDRQKYNHSPDGPMRPHSWNAIKKDLKRQEKVLRDHNLVMGPLSAFQGIETAK